MNKYFKIGVMTILIIITAVSSYLYYLHAVLERNVERIQITFEEDTDIFPKENNGKKALLFLLLGIGDRPVLGDPGRADSIIVISVNPSIKSAVMFSIPRDTRTKIIGKGFQDKINHSYAYGGTEMTKKTVEHFLNKSIDYVIQVNMEGLRQLVDAVGGIQVENEFPFEEKDELGEKVYYYDKGLVNLDGERALHYTRMRKSDPRGDFGRNERQRQVLIALVQKSTAFSSVFKIQEIINILGENIKTNIPFKEMKLFCDEFRKDGSSYNIETLEIKGTDKTIDGIYYYIVSEEECWRIANKLDLNSLTEIENFRERT
jgi:LCP family protein required for cell wall assembly